MKDTLRKKILKNGHIARISILSDYVFIRQAQDFVLSFARYFSFDQKELTQIELIVEEALLSTINTAFSDEVTGMIDVKVAYLPGKFIISIEDKGMPVDLKMLEHSDNSYISITLLRKYADEFRFNNLGKDGKKLELIKHINEPSILESSEESNLATSTQAEVSETEKPKMSLLVHDEVTRLSRLAFKVYGYTYISVFYYPEKISELLELGLLVSVVCSDGNNEIVGNLSLVFEKADDKVADSGAAMVDPRYRGHHLFKDMKRYLQAYATERGMYGIYSEAVTIHPFTQLGNISLGAKETGIMLAFIESSVTFNKIGNETTDERQSVVLYYLRTNKEPNRKIFINTKFADITRKIYQHAELDREVVEVDDESQLKPDAELTHYFTSVKPDLNVAYIKIEQMGADVDQVVAAQTYQFKLKKIDTIYLEFPLSESYSAVLTTKANQMGYLFSGIMPEFSDGDMLKMQYLNNISIDPEKINLAGELAKEMLQIIMQDFSK
jgi:anti-sigma regulatory factor (Ser/Thr protein kinase)